VSVVQTKYFHSTIFKSRIGGRNVFFLRCHARIKDGKEHRYWSVVENRRCGRGKKVVQRQGLYLGEINEIATDNSEGARAEVVVDEGLTYRRDQVTIAVDRYSPGVGDLIACL
jgi:hypothetical protein